MSKPLAVLADGSGFIYRAYYGLPPMTDGSGRPVGAVYGFCSMLIPILEKHKSDLFCVAFDVGRETFRSKIYPEYKANRCKTPEDLKAQMPLFREACRALGVPTVGKKGFEADDIIATYATKLSNRGYEVKIISSDKDLTQLITDGVSMFDPLKSKVIKTEEVVEKHGVPPSQMIFLQALMGDAADNIPGVMGIGPKTAAKLIGEFKTLENLYQNIDAVQPQRIREKLIAQKESALLSLKLVELDRNVELDEDAEDFKILHNRAKSAEFFDSLGFGYLTKRLAAL
jgi:DNA polymerase-1